MGVQMVIRSLYFLKYPNGFTKKVDHLVSSFQIRRPSLVFPFLPMPLYSSFQFLKHRRPTAGGMSKRKCKIKGSSPALPRQEFVPIGWVGLHPDPNFLTGFKKCLECSETYNKLIIFFSFFRGGGLWNLGNISLLHYTTLFQNFF